jgi:hypothetical protein
VEQLIGKMQYSTFNRKNAIQYVSQEKCNTVCLTGKMQYSMFNKLHGDSSDTLAQVTKQATIKQVIHNIKNL